MALEPGRILCATIVSVTLFVAGFAFASAAVPNRPNALDHRVDAISDHALLTQPASALVDPNRQAAAGRLAGLKLPGWVLMALFQAVALAYFWSSGAAAAVRDRLRRRLSKEWLVRFAFGAALALIARLAALFPSFYLYRVERVMQLSIEHTRIWALFWVAHTLLAMAIAGALTAIVLWLVDRTHQWYVYTIVIVLGASIAWWYVRPYFEVPGTRTVHVASGVLGSQINNVLGRGGIPHIPVFVEESNTSPLAGAVVLGLGPSERVVLSGSLVAGSTVPEIVYDVTYEIGHVVHADPLFFALIEGGIIIVFSAIAVVLADRVRFRRDDDPLSRLALVGALLAIVYLGAVPVRNAALREYDLDADRYAVGLTRDPAAAVRAIVRSTDVRMEEVCPEALPGIFLDVHPSAATRVAAINGAATACP
jgi:STE24 endopeptidase